MEEIIKQKCRAYFEAANEAEEVYVAGDKLFVDDGAARSYGEVVKVKRTDVIASKAPKESEEVTVLNPKVES